MMIFISTNFGDRRPNSPLLSAHNFFCTGNLFGISGHQIIIVIIFFVDLPIRFSEILDDG